MRSSFDYGIAAGLALSAPTRQLKRTGVVRYYGGTNRSALVVVAPRGVPGNPTSGSATPPAGRVPAASDARHLILAGFTSCWPVETALLSCGQGALNSRVAATTDRRLAQSVFNLEPYRTGCPAAFVVFGVRDG